MVKISGRFMDPDGEPVAGATITFIQIKNTANSFIQRLASMTTDDVGEYSISLASGDYRVKATYRAGNESVLGDISITGESADGTLNDFLITSAPVPNPIIDRMQQLYFAALSLSQTPAQIMPSASDIPSDATGFVLVVDDETKNSPALYLYAGGKRYWLAMVEDAQDE